MAYEPISQTSETGRPVSLYRNLTTTLSLYGSRLGRALVYSSAYIALIAMTEVAIAMVLLSLPLSPAPLVVGLVTFAVYAGDRLADVDTDEVSNPRQVAFVRRHEGILSVLAAASYGLAVTLSVLGGPVALGITLLPGVFWVLYASDWVPDVGLDFQRLKQVLIVNTTVVAFAWAMTLTFLPVAFADAAVTPVVAFVFVYFFFRSFVDTEIPNVRDVEADRETDVATMPVVFGVPRTRQALYGVDLFTVGLVGYAALSNHVPLALAAALFVGLVYSLGVTSLVGRVDDEELLAKAPEGEYILVAVALVPILVGT